MTQEVQPLTWQKRTNIEEHKQFFGKINEVVAQLSGTVERSETALASATAALSDAEAAVEEATAAYNRAMQALTQAQQYGTRISAVESQANSNTSAIGHLDIETRDLYDRDANSVKLSAGHIQVVRDGLDLRGTNHTANSDVGADNSVIVNGHRVIAELNQLRTQIADAYVSRTGAQTVSGQKTFAAPLASSVASPSNALVTKAEVYGTGKNTNNLVHNIGDENIGGNKRFTGAHLRTDGIIQPIVDTHREDMAGKSKFFLSVYDNNDEDRKLMGGFNMGYDAQGKAHMTVFVYDINGTWHGVNLI